MSVFESCLECQNLSNFMTKVIILGKYYLFPGLQFISQKIENNSKTRGLSEKCYSMKVV